MQRNINRFLWLLLPVLVATGCDAPEARFRMNMAYLHKNEKKAEAFTAEQKADVANILAALFGTPDQKEGMAAFTEKRKPTFGPR